MGYLSPVHRPVDSIALSFHSRIAATYSIYLIAKTGASARRWEAGRGRERERERHPDQQLGPVSESLSLYFWLKGNL